MIKNYFMALLAIAFLASCGNNPKTDEKKEVAAASEEVTSAVLTIEEWPDAAENFVDQSVSMEGTIVHVCKHGGKRFFISNEEGETRVKIELGDSEAAFSPEEEGAYVRVVGLVEEMRVDEAYLDEWQAEIEAKIAEGVEGHDDHGTGVHEGEEGHEHRGQHEELERVADLRKEIAENGKGYKSYFNLAYVSHEVLTEAPVKEETMEEGHDHDHDHDHNH